MPSMRSDPEADDDRDGEGAEEQDLLVVLRLSNRQMGTATERLELEEFAEQLEAAVTKAGVGEYDGDEVGGGECILFFCGKDVDALQRTLHPLLKKSPLCRGGHLVRMVADGDGEPQRTRIPL